jgi:hypothetical protein
MLSDRKLFTVSQFVICEISRVDKLYFLKILSAFLGVNPHFTQWFFKSEYVNGALLWASELGQLKLVNLLIKGGANLEFRDAKGLYVFCPSRYVNVFQFSSEVYCGQCQSTAIGLLWSTAQSASAVF